MSETGRSTNGLGFPQLTALTQHGGGRELPCVLFEKGSLKQ